MGWTQIPSLLALRIYTGVLVGNSGTRHHRFDHGQCSVTWILDYFTYVAYYIEKKKRGETQTHFPPRSKLSDLWILRHRLPMPQFRDGGEGGNYL